METETDSFEVERPFLFIGRTFAEYCQMFGLDHSQLGSRSILDCPGGPSSFAATAAQLGASVIAVDPAYGLSTRELAKRCKPEIDQTVAQLREKAGLFVLDEYRPPGGTDDDAVRTRGRYLRAAGHRFLADYELHPSRYVPAALPRLPFATNAFELVLSGNFLFLYDDQTTRSFHHEAVRELARVASEEVRIFPLAALDRERSSYVTPVVETLHASGLTVEYVDVPYEFQSGATRMLVISDVTRFRGGPAG